MSVFAFTLRMKLQEPLIQTSVEVLLAARKQKPKARLQRTTTEAFPFDPTSDVEWGN